MADRQSLAKKELMTNDDLMSQVAEKAGVSREIAFAVSSELLSALHREMITYDRGNKDYIGERVLWQIGDRGFYHLLGFLEQFSSKYSWEQGFASEYLLRLSDRDTWAPHVAEMMQWSMNSEKPSEMK